VRIFLAGASGVLGQRLVPRLLAAGHVVGGMTRSSGKAALLAELGAEPIVCDVYDRDELIQAVKSFQPDVVMNQLTDLPDDADDIAAYVDANARIRIEGNRNLIEAGRQGRSTKFFAQTVAWELPAGPGADACADLERATLAEGGVVLSYGAFYGPGTYNEGQVPADPKVQIDNAADLTVDALTAPSGVVRITD
jgi:hypothetical protein